MARPATCAAVRLLVMTPTSDDVCGYKYLHCVSIIQEAYDCGCIRLSDIGK